MFANIGNKLVNKFKAEIREDYVYIIKTFKVWEFEKYRPLKNNLKIHFLFGTTVKEVDEGESKRLPL
uniref:Replication protein A 70 kDa DNA-binding subunit B/D first OB fold domain-containing protein n=1 Tax=Aegilops tauschii subsp. strangulata TaxID=200361 RepID=A0A453SGT1_AEGTS